MASTEKTELRRRLAKSESTSQTLVAESSSPAVTEVAESTQTIDEGSSEDTAGVDAGGVDADGSGEKKIRRKSHHKREGSGGGGHVKVIHHKPRMRKRAHTAIFLLGSLFGILAAGFFAKHNDLIDFPIGEISMDSFLDVLPRSLVADMRDLVVSRSSRRP